MPKDLTRRQAIDYLTQDGNFDVPGGHYGSDTVECAAVAYRCAANLAWHNGDPINKATLEHLMRLVVNSHDDIGYILHQYRIPRPARKAKV